jgi:uncharacterized protein
VSSSIHSEHARRDLDRIAPTRRPAGPADGFQKWRKLLFLHWPVPVEALRAVVPRALELDLDDGIAWIGVVPFAMREVRPRWIPKAASFDFLETNVRTYVSFRGEPGVYFLSLEAASALACAAARVTFGLPYFWASMRMEQQGDEITYETVRRVGPPARTFVRYRIGAELPASIPGTRQFFLIERYSLFVERGDRILRGRVHHTPYRVHEAEVLEVHDELIGAAGLVAPAGGPSQVHYSPGVDVEVFGLGVA